MTDGLINHRFIKNIKKSKILNEKDISTQQFKEKEESRFFNQDENEIRKGDTETKKGKGESQVDSVTIAKRRTRLKMTW